MFQYEKWTAFMGRWRWRTKAYCYIDNCLYSNVLQQERCNKFRKKTVKSKGDLSKHPFIKPEIEQSKSLHYQSKMRGKKEKQINNITLKK